ncbi:MAG TPA: glycerophosphodiester phosphodiesterase family protein [Hyphomicrobiaceae bacterium]|nr:glycerophosphodiester phosphodiesterase family protein [Hyphomicrobiaceae bacterium]
MLDRSVFLRPIAHRGLHDQGRGRIENTASAFKAAIAKGYGIECDLRPARDGTPFVFHDLELKRLVEATGRISERTPAEIGKLRLRGSEDGILAYGDFLDLVGGRVPLLVEIKSEWDTPDVTFLKKIADISAAHKGPLALMSFDPGLMAAVRPLAPAVPRGIVSGGYTGHDWWRHRIDLKRAFRLKHLLESGPVAPSFFSYHVKSLPTPVTRFVREVLAIPLFTWTVRSAVDRAITQRWADAMTFEGFEP